MKKVIIIGAGPAGLTAALELLKNEKDISVVILEETEAIGGISRTVNYKGNRMDIGGHRFFSKDERVMKWWQNTLPLQGAPSMDDRALGRESELTPGGPNPDTQDQVMLIRNRVSRIFYHHKFFDYPISMKWQTIRNMGFLCTMRAGFSYLYSCVSKKKEDSLENFYCNRFGKVLYSMFFEGYTEKLWGRHPKEISADWGAQRVKGLSILAILKDMIGKIFHTKDQKKVETSLIEKFWYPKHGPGQLWEKVAADVQSLGGEIKFSCKVTGLEQGEKGQITKVCYENQGQLVAQEADVVISTMPLKDLVVGLKGQVPAEVRRVAEGLPYRDFVTVGLLVPKLQLKNETNVKTFNNMVPDCWIYVQDTGVKLGRIQLFNNWSPYMVQNPDQQMFIGLEYFCQEGDSFWNMSQQECVDYAVKELVSMGVLGSKEEVLDSHRERVKKAYPAYFDTYDEIQTVIDYVNTIDNLYCIGRNGQHRYNNMDHSMATAFAAVEHILGKTVDKDEIWQVNTEKEYHEERK